MKSLSQYLNALVADLISGNCSIGYHRQLGYTHYPDIVSGIKEVTRKFGEVKLFNKNNNEPSEGKDLVRAIAALLNQIKIDHNTPIEDRPKFILDELTKLLEIYLPALKVQFTEIYRKNIYFELEISGPHTNGPTGKGTRVANKGGHRQRSFDVTIAVPQKNLIKIV